MSEHAGTIVVVDDEPIVLEFCRTALMRAGYTVYTASSGEAALLHFQLHRTPIDLTLIDVVMPGMGGITLVKRLRSMDTDTRIALMSGHSPEEVRRIVGGDTFRYRSMWKPFSAGTLVQMVKNLLNEPTEIGGRHVAQSASGE